MKNVPVRETLRGVPVAFAAATDGEVSDGVRVEIGLRRREKENFDIRGCHPILQDRTRIEFVRGWTTFKCTECNARVANGR